MALSDFIPTDQQERIAQAITEAEKCTSGEIVVHVTPRCRRAPMDGAKRIFKKFGLQNTERRNAVLIYIAYEDHKLAVIGDKGIYDNAPADIWNEDVALLTDRIASGRQVDGLCEVIARIGQRLSHYFPSVRDDVNEISNDVQYSEDDDD